MLFLFTHCNNLSLNKPGTGDGKHDEDQGCLPDGDPAVEEDERGDPDDGEEAHDEALGFEPLPEGAR